MDMKDHQSGLMRLEKDQPQKNLKNGADTKETELRLKEFTLRMTTLKTLLRTSKTSLKLISQRPIQTVNW